MKRFTWDEMREYWGHHNVLRAQVDRDTDPDALDNVLHTGEPPWLNQYYAKYQRITYESLLAGVPPPRPGARALDVGCGAGRWCRLLAQWGYRVTGIDLQESLIQENQRRNPTIEFQCVSLQDFRTEEPYDLVSTVTVIQHNPHDEQHAMIAQLRRLLRPGGHALILENIRDQGAHVFSNSVEEWERRFASHGFRRVLIQRYDYSPLTRIYATVRGRVAAIPRRFLGGAPQGGGGVEVYMTSHIPRRNGSMGALRRGDLAIRHILVRMDDVIEPTLTRRNLPLPTVHCGFLFEAV
ncbi:MAG: class I SAM-dependent methyltransferase [Myxococcota bacterium]